MRYLSLAPSALFLTFSLFLTAQAQDPSKILIADGAKYYSSNSIYGAYANELSSLFWNLTTVVGDESVYVSQPIRGKFSSKKVYGQEAHIFSICGKDGSCRQQGIAVVVTDQGDSKATVITDSCIFAYESEATISELPDLNNNGTDEIAIIFQRKNRMVAKIIEFTAKGITSFGTREIYNLDVNPAFRAKLFAEKGTELKFYEERETITAKGWAKAPLQEIKLDEDKTQYIRGRERNAILKHLSFFTFLTQAIAFIGLLALVLYEVFASGQSREQKETQKKEREERRAGKTSPITEDNFPKLIPINCQSCGAGVPLQESEMTCPNCGTKTKAPENYFNVAKARDDINGKIRSATAYLKRTAILSSGWVRALIGLLALWLAISMIAVFVLSSKGNFEPYQSYIFGSNGFKALGGFASFTNCFWVVSLLLGFAIWSPRLKKALPTVEFGENISKAENGNCPQCAGGISYQANDLATVCGYCGVETYRAKLAWKLRNLTNSADKKASFSLIEARKSAEDAIEDVIGAPKVIMFLLILAAILGLIMWLLSAGYDMLPDWLKGVFEVAGEILDAFS